MTQILFSSKDIIPTHLNKNFCYRVKNLIIDTREDKATFWVDGKRLTRFLDRDSEYRMMCEEFGDGTMTPGDLVIIDDPLFIVYDNLNKTSGHFFVDCLPRLWYYERMGASRFMKLGVVFSKDKQYDPRQILDLKYKNNIVVLDRGAVYLVKEAVIPGTYIWWDDIQLSKRFMVFIDSYFENVVTDPEPHNQFYLSRKDVVNLGTRRVLVNEDELIEKLKSHGIVSKELMPLTALEFISCFRNKKQIIGCEGSGWNYSILASPKTMVTTIMHPRINVFFYWLHEIQKHKDIALKFIYPEIEIYDDRPNSAWKILNLNEVVDQITANLPNP